jgi:hypothetical protein
MDDDDVQEYESSGWRKRQISNRDATNIRNATLEEVAQEIEKMKAFGQDTIASFAVHIRSMKHDYFC